MKTTPEMKQILAGWKLKKDLGGARYRLRLPNGLYAELTQDSNGSREFLEAPDRLEGAPVMLVIGQGALGPVARITFASLSAAMPCILDMAAQAAAGESAIPGPQRGPVTA